MEVRLECRFSGKVKEDAELRDSISKVSIFMGLVLGVLTLAGVVSAQPCTPGSTFSFSGYTYNTTKDPLNATNVTIEVYQFGPGGPPTLNSSYSNLTNASGFFNISGIIVHPVDPQLFMYKPVIRKYNSSDPIKVDYIGQILPHFPCFEVATLGTVDFYLKEAATLNVTAVGEEQELDSMVEGTGSPIAANDYNTSLEWISENNTWAYINDTGHLVILNSNFSFNSSTPQPVMENENATALYYNGSGIYYAANSTTVVVFSEDDVTPIYTYDISLRNYADVQGLEYNSDDRFYISATNMTSQPVVDSYNSTFENNVTVAPVDIPSGKLARHSGNWYMAYDQGGGNYRLNKFTDNWTTLWSWNFNKSVGGIAHNGSSWYYASLDSNITPFTLTDLGVKSFQYYVKDTKLGYPVAENFGSNVQQATIHVPADRNYSIEMFPSRAMPVSYDLNNISDYGASPKIDIVFNITERMKWVSGYVNYSGGYNFSDLRVVPYLLEPGNMVFSSYPMPYNMSAWREPFGTMSDYYNASIGFYNITLPGSAMGADILLFVTARNGSEYYGGFQNITLYATYSDVKDLNLTLQQLLGNVTNISMDNAANMALKVNVTTMKKSFKLQNATGSTPNNAFVEFTVDYTSYYPGSISFSWMTDIGSSANGTFTLPVISANVKTVNIFSPDFAPKKTSLKASALSSDPVIITLTSFRPGAIEEGEVFTDLKIDMFKSNPTCNVPYPPPSCSLLPAEKNLTDFNPLSVIIGGGDISFRMKQISTNITVHYNKVDLLASGPPDALFDSNSSEKSTADGTLAEAWRFGSSGPEIYESVLLGIPYNKSEHPATDNFTVRIKYFYDEDWNVIWNISQNTTAQIPSDYSDYLTDKYNAYVDNSTDPMPCSKTNVTSTCYVNTSRGMVWMQIPHFSGVGPEVSGEDTVPPSIDLITPNRTFLNSSVSLAFVTSDDKTSTIGYNLTIDGVVNKSGTATSGANTTEVISGFLDGDYNWSVVVWDDANNTNTSETRNFTVLTQVAVTPVTVQPIDNTTNSSGLIDLATRGVQQAMIEQMGVTSYEYLVTTNGTTPVVNVSVNISLEPPAEATDISDVSGAISGFYYKINVNDSLWFDNVTNVQLRIYYNISNINLPTNVQESSLRLARYTNGSWVRLDCSALGGCTATLDDGTELYVAGVVTSSQNATHPYVWANLSNFSVYGIAGEIAAAPAAEAPVGAIGVTTVVPPEKEVSAVLPSQIIVGESVELKVTVKNTRNVQEPYKISFPDLPSGWTITGDTLVTIPANGEKVVTYTLSAPSTASLGTYTFTTKVEGVNWYHVVEESASIDVIAVVPVVTTVPPVVTTAPPVVTTAPPVVTTAPPVVTTAPPVTAPPVVTTAPPVVTTAPPTTAPPVTTAPPKPPRKRFIVCGPTAILLLILISALGVNVVEKRKVRI